MGLEQASDVGSIQDVTNMLQLQGALFYFVLPFISTLLIIYFVRYLKKRADRKTDLKIEQANAKEKEKQLGKNQQEVIKKQQITKTKRHKPSRPFPSNEYMMHLLDDIDEPLIKSDYNNLTINFDKNGRIIKENNSWQQ